MALFGSGLAATGSSGGTQTEEMIIMTITKLIALKGAVQDFFYNLLTAPRTVSNTYALVGRTQSGTNHVQHIERLSRATCRVPRGTKGQLMQLLNLTELKSHLFSLYLNGLTMNRSRRGGNWSTRRKPLTKSFRKCHVLSQKIQAPSETRTRTLALVAG